MVIMNSLYNISVNFVAIRMTDYEYFIQICIIIILNLISINIRNIKHIFYMNLSYIFKFIYKSINNML